MNEARWIDCTASLAEALSGIARGGVAVDTEADSLHHYREKVCLIQLSLGGRHLLVDPLSSVDLAPLRALLADGVVRKTLHGADYDVRLLRRDLGIEIRGVFDTMVAARLCGEKSWGLSALLEQKLGVRLDKRFQKADWSIRPLPDAMRAYAVADTCHLEALAELLERELERTGRSAWAAEEFLCVEAVGSVPRESLEPHERVRGTRDLSRRQLAVLRELAALRVAEAERTDRPLFRVMRDEVLCALARAAPRTGDALRGLAELPDSWRDGERAARLLAGVERAMALPTEALPGKPVRPVHVPDAKREARLRRGLGARDRLAEGLGLDPTVVAPRAVVEAVLDRLGQGGSLDGVPGLRTWQKEVLGPALAGV